MYQVCSTGTRYSYHKATSDTGASWPSTQIWSTNMMNPNCIRPCASRPSLSTLLLETDLRCRCCCRRPTLCFQLWAVRILCLRNDETIWKKRLGCFGIKRCWWRRTRSDTTCIDNGPCSCYGYCILQHPNLLDDSCRTPRSLGSLVGSLGCVSTLCSQLSTGVVVLSYNLSRVTVDNESGSCSWCVCYSGTPWTGKKSRKMVCQILLKWAIECVYVLVCPGFTFVLFLSHYNHQVREPWASYRSPSIMACDACIVEYCRECTRTMTKVACCQTYLVSTLPMRVTTIF